MERDSNLYDFSLLPPHIIAQILVNLDFKQRLDAGRVCSSWYFATCDPMITKNICIKIRSFEHLDELNRPFGNLYLLHTNFNNFQYKNFFVKFGKYVKMLEFINCELSLCQLLDCVTLMTNLSTFKIQAKDTFLSQMYTIECDVATVIGTNLNRIKYFSVDLDTFDAGALAFLMSMMPNLKRLSYTTTIGIYSTLFDYLKMLDNVNLDELKLDKLYRKLPDNFFKDFTQIQHSNLNIHSLRLGNIQSLNGFKHFCKKLTNLREFSIILIWSIDEQLMIDVICRYMTRLTMLELDGLRKCSNLHMLGTLPHLEKLTINYQTVYAMRTEDNEKPLTEMFLKLHNLRSLRINGLVSENILTSICENCRNLTTLELTKVEVDSFTAIFQHLRKLQRLHLTFKRRQLKNMIVDHNITNLQLLEELTISDFAPGMTLRLIEQLPNLKLSSIELIRKIPESYRSKIVELRNRASSLLAL